MKYIRWAIRVPILILISPLIILISLTHIIDWAFGEKEINADFIYFFKGFSPNYYEDKS